MSEEQKLTEKQQEEKKKEEKKQDGPNLVDLVKKHPESPSQETIEQWKAKYGEIFASGLSNEELFIFRPLNRSEWVTLQETISKPELEINNYQFEEMVCDSCLLWKSIKVSWAQGKAGTPTSLYEQIMQNSNFMTPQAASLFVVKL